MLFRNRNSSEEHCCSRKENKDEGKKGIKVLTAAAKCKNVAEYSYDDERKRILRCHNVKDEKQ